MVIMILGKIMGASKDVEEYRRWWKLEECFEFLISLSKGIITVAFDWGLHVFPFFIYFATYNP